MNTFLHEHWRRKLNVALFLLLLIAATIFGSMTMVRSQGTPRKIVSDDFTNNRPAAAAATPIKGTPGGSTRPRPKPPRTYTRVSQPATKPQPTSGGTVIAQLGITVWRLHPANASDAGQRALIREKGKSGWIAERVSGDTTFREGDHVRITIESPRAGYLYVIDRDLFADGTTGGAMLIYPWKGVDNHVTPGRLIDFPGEDENPSYFTARVSSPNQMGELLTFIVTSSPLTELPIGDQPFQIATGLMRNWEKLWGGEAERFEMEGGAGEAWTELEQQAAAKGGTRQLTREDPAPQTIYRVSTTDSKAILVHVRLRYAK